MKRLPLAAAVRATQTLSTLGILVLAALVCFMRRCDEGRDVDSGKFKSHLTGT